MKKSSVKFSSVIKGLALATLIAESGLVVIAASGTITIDAGHGYNTPGKRAVDDSIREWEVNDRVAIYVEQKLTEQGFTVHRLDDRSGNTDVSLDSRLAQACSYDPDLHISINQNALDDTMWSNATGTETYYSVLGSERSQNLARSVAQRMANYIETTNRGAKGTTNELFITREFTASGIDAILTEGLFMSNKEDVEYMQTWEYISEYGQAIVDGVLETYGNGFGEASNFIVRVRKENEETLNIRSSASFTAEVVGEVNPGEVFTIVETKNGLGKLASGAGWISLNEKYVERIASIN